MDAWAKARSQLFLRLSTDLCIPWDRPWSWLTSLEHDALDFVRKPICPLIYSITSTFNSTQTGRPTLTLTSSCAYIRQASWKNNMLYKEAGGRAGLSVCLCYQMSILASKSNPYGFLIKSWLRAPTAPYTPGGLSHRKGMRVVLDGKTPLFLG